MTDPLKQLDLTVFLSALSLYLPYSIIDLGSLVGSRSVRDGWDWSLQHPANFITCVLSGLILVVALTILARLALSAVADDRRKYARFLLLLAGISTALGLVAAWFILTGRAPNGLRLQGPLRLAAAAIMAYAIVKHHAFGIDLALKWTLTRGTIIAAFAGAFFVVEQIAQFYVSAAYGTLAGIVAALLLLVAFKPLRKFAHRLADRVFPGVAPTPEYYDARRLVVYRAAAQTAYKDGVVTTKERAMLDALVRELRIPEQEARNIERSVSAA